MMINKRLTLFLLSFVLLLSMSCSLFGSRQTPSPQNTENSIWIKADQGGVLQLPDGASLEIAPKSLPAEGEISLEQVSETAQAADYFTPAGSLYEVSLGAPVLDPPATLTLPYDPALLPPDITPETLFLAYYDEAAGEWVYAGGEVDINRQVVSVQTNHASRWSVFHWNWDAWIAILSKTLEGNWVDWYEAGKLLLNDCPQTGESVGVNNVDGQNILQGCIDVDDPLHPQLRVVNPKSFYYEIATVSGRPHISQILGPGESVEFAIDLREPSPLIVGAQITQAAGYRLVIHMVLSTLPGFNVFDNQPKLLACMTERLKDVSYLASGVEALLDGNGAAASEQLIDFYRDNDAMRRFLTAAEDCGSGVAKTWDLSKVGLVASLSNVIISGVDYIANSLALYARGETMAQVEFFWIMALGDAPTQTSTLPLANLPPLDRTDAQSVLDWVQYAIESGDIRIFDQLMADKMGYANYLEGGQSISPDEFLSSLEQRMTSHPTCLGVFVDQYSLDIWYTNWSPAWVMTEMCYIGCSPIDPPWLSSIAGFFFANYDGNYELKVMYLNTPEKYFFTDTLPLQSCGTDVSNFVIPTQGAQCPGSPPQRLEIGEKGSVCTRRDSVILREQPGRESARITKLPPGTTFTVIAGPECAGSNWSWWQVRTENGHTGWLAEGGDNTDPYFLCPLP